jgi:hypothetical protein
MRHDSRRPSLVHRPYEDRPITARVRDITFRRGHSAMPGGVHFAERRKIAVGGRDEPRSCATPWDPGSYVSEASVERAAMKASWGTSTRPTIFIRFLPSFCFSRSLRLRVMSPP